MALSLVDRLHYRHRCWRYRLRTERLPLSVLAALRLRGATVLDIGANRGLWCHWLHRAVGPSGRVIAFEPQPELGDALQAIARWRGWPGFRLVRAGLSDAPGRLVLRRGRVGDGSATFEPREDAPGRQQVEVEVTTLDAVLDPGRPVRFAKCDVEGHEWHVLRGGARWLARDRPALLVEGRVADPKTDAMMRDLAPLGYRAVVLMNGTMLPWRDAATVPHERFGLVGHRDFLLLPGRAPDWLQGRWLGRFEAAALPAG